MTTPSGNPESDEPITILLVEDNPGDVRLTREAFEAANFEHRLHVVPTGDDAIDFLTHQGEHATAPYPDLVLLDLNLPGKNGDEVLGSIRENPQLTRLPVLMLTSSVASEDIVACYEATANAYLTKPSDFDEFVSLVKALERFWIGQARLPRVPA